jgi:hypothetical protein
MRIIGLTGFARSGKDTVAALIEEHFDGTIKTVAFADLIKVSAARALGVLGHPDDVGVDAVRRWADDLKTSQYIKITDARGCELHSITGRQFLQRYGSEAHRDLFGEDFWIEQIDFAPDCDLLIFTDCRFVNEADAIHANGGEVWRINRPSTSAGSHVSEVALPPELVDLELLNAGTLQDLAASVGRAVKELVAAHG